MQHQGGRLVAGVVGAVPEVHARPLQAPRGARDEQADTPQALALYVHAFDPSFAGITGEPAAIAAVAQQFGVAVSRVDLPGGDYTMDHSAVVFLLDDAARIRAIFTPPFAVGPMAAD